MTQQAGKLPNTPGIARRDEVFALRNALRVVLLTSKATNKAAEVAQEAAYAAYLASFTAQEKQYVVSVARSWQREKRRTGFFQDVELNSFEDVARNLGRGLIHDFIAKAQEEAVLRSSGELLDAHKLIPAWTQEHSHAAAREGWDIWDSEGSSNGRWQVQRIDDPVAFGEAATFVPPTLGSDEDALQIVANGTDPHHVAARQFLLAHNLAEYEAMVAFRVDGKLPAKRIAAVFQPQAWVNDCATDIDGQEVVDVTDRVLRLSLDRIHGLQDYRDSTDDLMDGSSAVMKHDGPFTVRAVDSVREFFGVKELSDVTEDMLASARQATLKPQHYQDDEVIGFDKDGCVMQWDADKGLAFNSGESLDEFGLHNLRERELSRVNVCRATWLAAVAEQAAKHVVTVEVAVPGLDPKFASESTYTAGMRVARMEQAVKAWNVADESDKVCAQPDEHAVVCMLADLRHYCDAHGMGFAQMDRHAYADYLEQKANDRHHGHVRQASSPGM